MPEPTPPETLADLRGEIDRIDRAMHGLLMERGTIIDRIIAAKQRLGGGSAFHPGREAAMMRALVERHAGALPLDTVESIWRVIIATFTFIQMDYAVHADIAADPARMRDTARFHFGFTVPYRTHPDADAVIDAIEAASRHGRSDLGLVPVLRSAREARPWWARLTRSLAPKIIARLPFVERPDHPAGLPVFVVANPLAETAVRDVALFAVTLERWCDGVPGAVVDLGGEVVDVAGEEFGASLLLALPGTVPAERLRHALVDAGTCEPCLVEVGSHAGRFEVAATPPGRAAA